MKDFYVVLGLARDASLDEVKRAYRRLARKYHPDINPGDRMAAAEFRRIAQAYQTLIDPDRRRRYDTGGTASRSGSRSRSSSKDLTSRCARAIRRHRPSETCSPMCWFSVGEPCGSGAPERGADLHHDRDVVV